MVVGSEVVYLWDDGLLISGTASIELFFVGCLIVNEKFGVNEFVAIEHFDFSDREADIGGVSFLDEVGVIDEGDVDVGTRLPEGVHEGDEHDDAEDTEDDMIGVFVKKILFLFGPVGLGLFGSFLHGGVGFNRWGSLLGRL